MTKSEKQCWEQERAKGYDHYLLRRGLRVGLLCACVGTLFQFLGSFFWHHALGSVWNLLATFGCMTVLCGYIIARMNWRDNEAEFNKPAEDEETSGQAREHDKSGPSMAA